jgi:hypothetical protein
VRPFPLLAAAAVHAAAGLGFAGAAGTTGIGSTVIVSATVAGAATDTMPVKLWRKLVVDAVAPRTVVPDDEPSIADDARCRAAHAAYALLATFELAPRLPGLAQDPVRTYAIARVTVRNCATGTALPARVIPLESDPTAEPARGETEPNAARLWERPVRAALGHDALIAQTMRVVSVRKGIVLIERFGTFGINQVLRATPAPSSPARAAYELVVTDVTAKYLQATVLGRGDPRPGDTIEAAPPK